jgi:hypothetical protein
MYRVREQDLPFQGAVPGPTVIRTTKSKFVREGRGLWTVNGEEFEVQLDVHLSPRFIQENLT